MDQAKHQRAQLRIFVAVLRETVPGRPAEHDLLRRSLHGLAQAFANGLEVPTGGHPLMAQVWADELAKAGEAIAAFSTRWGGPGRIEEGMVMFTTVRDQFTASLLRLLDRLDAGFAGICSQSPMLAPPATGNASLDRDHAELFALLGGLRAVQGDGVACVTGNVVSGLATYAERHFEAEDRMMVDSGFPGMDDHRAEHQRARMLILGFRNDHNDGRCVPPAMLLAFLEHWFTSHIAHTDQALARHLQTQP